MMRYSNVAERPSPDAASEGFYAGTLLEVRERLTSPLLQPMSLPGGKADA